MHGRADAAADYAQQIPVRVIAAILGVSDAHADMFTGWVRDVLEFADDPERRVRGVEGLINYFLEEIQNREGTPGEDLLSMLLHSEVDGAPVEESLVLGTAALVLIAGVDTTWSAIGSSLWHLATNLDDRKRLVAEPELMPFAVEELLRAYSPVTMARIVTKDVDFAHCPMRAGDKILMNFPAANRDPEAFEDRRQGRPGSCGKPSRGLRIRDSPVCRLQPGADGAARGTRGVATPDPGVPICRREPRSRGPGAGAGSPYPPGGVPVRLRVDPLKCQGHARCFALVPELFEVDDYGMSSVKGDGTVAPRLSRIGRGSPSPTAPSSPSRRSLRERAGLRIKRPVGTRS